MKYFMQYWEYDYAIKIFYFFLSEFGFMQEHKEDVPNCSGDPWDIRIRTAAFVTALKCGRSTYGIVKLEMIDISYEDWPVMIAHNPGKEKFVSVTTTLWLKTGIWLLWTRTASYNQQIYSDIFQYTTYWSLFRHNMNFKDQLQLPAYSCFSWFVAEALGSDFIAPWIKMNLTFVPE